MKIWVKVISILVVACVCCTCIYIYGSKKSSIDYSGVSSRPTSGLHTQSTNDLHTNPDEDKIIKVFLQSGKKPTENDLVDAIEKGYPDFFKLLLDHGADPNFRFGINNRPLIMEAVYLNQLGMVQLLLDKGADPNLTDSETMNALMFARDLGNEKAVEMLIKGGADPNLFMKPGTEYGSQANDSTIPVTEPTTAYDIAKAADHQKIASLLQSYGGKSGKQLKFDK